MVDAEEFKNHIRGILSQQREVSFLGKDFDIIVQKLSEDRAGKLYDWIRNVIEREIQPIVVNSKGTYKEWNGNELLVFRQPLDLDGAAYRILLVKVKNSIYIEFHLGDHKYYDKVRKDIGLKKGNY